MIVVVQDYWVAHTPNREGIWHGLTQHLLSVAAKAAEFAFSFNASSLAWLLGLLHDLGKCNPEFKYYLEARSKGLNCRPVPHSIWGASLAYKLLPHQVRDRWPEIVLPIYGHHGGLTDPGTLEMEILNFLQQNPQALKLMVDLLHALRTTRVSSNISFPDVGRNSTRREFFIRMLFSSLVDADYLDTEAHFEPARTQLRSHWPSVQELWERFEPGRERFLKRREEKGTQTDPAVLQVRREVYEACLKAAKKSPGIFRLTVPTGGGKTISGLAFALKHACTHDLRRVIVALPYTSIIDQTARVYREVLGDDALLEHHSAFELRWNGEERQDEEAVRLRLASENWEAPLIVTTTVQLFESLFSNRPSKCRKLHNIARSVVILDEVQTLPPHVLEPTLDVLCILVEDYDTTVVLSTATQPAFEAEPFASVFATDKLRGEIAPNYSEHFKLVRRVTYEFRREPLSWAELAAELREYPQVMVVLNTRRDALAVVDQLGHNEDVFHLSTLLCSAHRREVLDEIRRRLDADEPVKLISTQVVEAGVDLDFPVVYRAIGPLDRIVQVAGRCNREGKLGHRGGQVVLFEPAEGSAPRGPYMVGLEKARFLLHENPVEKLDDPELHREYFRRLYADVALDKKEIQRLRKELRYPEVAAQYRLIEEDTVPVVVPYGEALERLEEWLKSPGWRVWRGLQPYIVSLLKREVFPLERAGWLEGVTEGLYRWRGKYDERKGLVQALYDPSDLIV